MQRARIDTGSGIVGLPREATVGLGVQLLAGPDAAIRAAWKLADAHVDGSVVVLDFAEAIEVLVVSLESFHATGCGELLQLRYGLQQTLGLHPLCGPLEPRRPPRR